MPRRITAALSLALFAGCGDAASEDEPEPIRSDTLVVYSSLPRSGASAAVGDAVAAGQRLALADAGRRVAGRRLKLVELDSAEPEERDWTPDRVEENAETAADDPAAIAYLGDLELGASAVSLPVTNEESILQVSPTDGLTSLTIPQTGPGAGPERFYPAERRSFLRLVPPDSSQAAPLVGLAQRAGAQRVALVHDGGIYARQLAGGVEQAAVDQGLEVTRVERLEPDPEDAPELARKLTRDPEEAPDGVIYLGIGGEAGQTMLAAMQHGGLRGLPLVAAAPMARPGAVVDRGHRPFEALAPIPPARLHPPEGRRVLARLGRGGSPAPVEALYGYESMRLLLAALGDAGAGVADRRAVIEAARRQGGSGSVIGRYRFDARGDTSLERLAVYRVEGGRPEYRGRPPSP